MAALKAAGIDVWEQVGSVAEAVRAVEAGVDVVIAQGSEAGGHNYGSMSTLALVPAVRHALPNATVLAAGGIVDGAGLAAALCLGADGAWVGTRFLATHESQAHPEWKRRLVAAEGFETTRSHVFGRHHADFNPMRVLRNRVVREWEARVAEIPVDNTREPASLPVALKGIEVVFLACSDDPQQAALGINMINACRVHGVRHVVKLSAQSAGLQPPVSFGRMHAKAEQALSESGMAWTFLRPVFFVQSLLFFADSIQSGKLIAATGKGKVAWVDVLDVLDVAEVAEVAEVAASVLMQPTAHASKVYTLTGSTAHSFAAVTEMLHTATGRPVKHISPPAWFAKLVLPLASGMPRWQSNLAVELTVAISKGAQQAVSDGGAALLAAKPRAVQAFIAENRAAWGAGKG